MVQPVQEETMDSVKLPCFLTKTGQGKWVAFCPYYPRLFAEAATGDAAMGKLTQFIGDELTLSHAGSVPSTLRERHGHSFSLRRLRVPISPTKSS